MVRSGIACCFFVLPKGGGCLREGVVLGVSRLRACRQAFTRLTCSDFGYRTRGLSYESGFSVFQDMQCRGRSNTSGRAALSLSRSMYYKVVVG